MTLETGATRVAYLRDARDRSVEAAGGILRRRLPTPLKNDRSKTDTARESPGVLRGEVLIRIVSQPKKPPGPIVVGAEAPRGDRSGVAQSALTQDVQGHVRAAVRNLRVQVPVALPGVKAIVRDHENGITEAAFRLVAGAQRDRIVRVEIEVEIRPGIGTPQARDPIPRAAHLDIDAGPRKPPCCQLQGRLHLQILRHLNGGIGPKT